LKAFSDFGSNSRLEALSRFQSALRLHQAKRVRGKGEGLFPNGIGKQRIWLMGMAIGIRENGQRVRENFIPILEKINNTNDEEKRERRREKSRS